MDDDEVKSFHIISQPTYIQGPDWR